MPRGKYVNHKGRSRHFTSPEELQQDDDDQSSSNDEEGEAVAGTNKTDDEEEEESSEDDRDAKKGVASLIEIENPNRAVKKSTKKLATLTLDDKQADNIPKPTLTRREREQIEKQKARQRYEKLHAEGKTSQAKADLARLALIRHQRAEAAAKRDAEKKAIEEKKASAADKA